MKHIKELIRSLYTDLLSKDKCKTCGNTSLGACDYCTEGDNYHWYREAELNKALDDLQEEKK